LAAGADAGQACSVPRAVHPPRVVVVEAVTRALAEDLVPLGDLTSALLPDDLAATAAFVARRPGVLAGRACATETFHQIDDTVDLAWQLDDGDTVAAGSVLATATGPLASILTAERTALNFLGHLSGIATLTRAFVDTAAGAGTARIWDTRKTTPGLRSLEKAAVRAGGGANHRGNLSDWILLKDNHIALFGITDAVARAHAMWPARTVHVECDRLDQVQEALAAGADALLLDNMTPDEVRACVAAADAAPRRPLLEVSGGVTLDTVASYAGTGVDCISVGGLTNAAPVLDIGLDIEPG
jgi:nicotinate-nucleotide pyrophosphorylase (carboxylating)